MPALDSALLRQVHSLYSEHHRWLQGWLRRKIGCSHGAADVAHDTFLRLLNRDEAIAIDEPRAFLTTVAKRVLSNRWRRQQVERAYLEALAALSEAMAPSPEERAMLIETLVEIARLLDGLPAVVKQAFLHAQLDGMSHAEIASELGISVSTVKRHLVRAGTQCFFALEPG